MWNPGASGVIEAYLPSGAKEWDRDLGLLGEEENSQAQAKMFAFCPDMQISHSDKLISEPVSYRNYLK